jgi:methylmalonyl-CoA mutase C-terminal domain/subunit
MIQRHRILIAKPGLDGHNRGAKVVARALMESGFEVILTGLHQTPEQIVCAAIEEGVDAIGLSVLSGAHMSYFRRVLNQLAEHGVGDIPVFGGGIISRKDADQLKSMGVAGIFGPGTPTAVIVDFVRELTNKKS